MRLSVQQGFLQRTFVPAQLRPAIIDVQQNVIGAAVSRYFIAPVPADEECSFIPGENLALVVDEIRALKDGIHYTFQGTRLRDA
jgi:hypothetical protein